MADSLWQAKVLVQLIEQEAKIKLPSRVLALIERRIRYAMMTQNGSCRRRLTDELEKLFRACEPRAPRRKS